MLEANNLSYKCQNRFLIENISLDFRAGNLYGILGSNGSGKTTLLKCLCGLWKPSSGLVKWNHMELHSLARKEISRVVSFVPHSPTVPFDFTISEMVEMGCYSGEQTSPGELTRVMEMVDILHLQSRKINQVSCGEKQRVYLARAIISQAPILILDEPTASLDIQHQIQIWKILSLLREQGKTLIISTHDIQAAKQHCTHGAILDNGRVLQTGRIHEILQSNEFHQLFSYNFASTTL